MKPAVPKRKGVNPLLKEECVFKQSVNVVNMKDDFAENWKSLVADDMLADKLVESCSRQSAECDEHRKN